MSRKVADCTKQPNEVGCTLVIIGEEEEVVRAAADHAVAVHSEADSGELRDWIRRDLQDEQSWLAAHVPA
ncbi:DUF1059 domain-containing protein [Streptomyces sp. GC420]|uniref:DUF1059 domain-containing protein n=1 Tax=Streptomyces sp. GC420 TaxID=2697568 RepID=UPI0014152CB1|nr:DUF1059 domain-containing protein [Streptomyces sp. GC420]NBM19769.1 DUF1059 domain-containing protein [Streptomyces sp. GC420]